MTARSAGAASSSIGCSSRSARASTTRSNTRSGKPIARELPVVVGFGLTDGYPEANLRHYAFMLQGLRDVAATTSPSAGSARDAPRRARPGGAGDGRRCGARGLRSRLSAASEAMAGKRRASGRPAVSSRSRATWSCRSRSPPTGTRSRHARCARSCTGSGTSTCKALASRRRARIPAGSLSTATSTSAISGGLLDGLEIGREVPPVRRFEGGTGEAHRRLGAFLRDRLKGYAEGRSEPAAYQCSMLSPYLHFGQISPVEIALAARDRGRARSERPRLLP